MTVILPHTVATKLDPDLLVAGFPPWDCACRWGSIMFLTTLLFTFLASCYRFRGVEANWFGRRRSEVDRSLCELSPWLWACLPLGNAAFNFDFTASGSVCIIGSLLLARPSFLAPRTSCLRVARSAGRFLTTFTICTNRAKSSACIELSVLEAVVRTICDAGWEGLGQICAIRAAFLDVPAFSFFLGAFSRLLDRFPSSFAHFSLSS